MKTVDCGESLGRYVVGWFLLACFVAFILAGLFIEVRQAPFIAIPFFGVFLFMAGKAGFVLARNTRAYLNFGRLRLELEGVPAVGGELKGVIRLNGAAAPSRIEAQLVWKLEVRKAGRTT